MAHRFASTKKDQPTSVVLRPQGLLGPVEVHSFPNQAAADAFMKERRAARKKRAR